MHRATERQHFTHGKQNTCLPIFKCLQMKRATGQRRPLLYLKTQRLELPARRWKRSFQLGIWSWDAMWALYPRQTKYLFADLWLFTSREGDEVTSPSFVPENKAIDAPSSSLEALIATQYMQMGCDGNSLPTANKTPVCQSVSIYKRRGRRGNVALFHSWKRNDWCYQIVAGSARSNIANA